MASVSEHYLGPAGERYFAYQNAGGDARGRINARKFLMLAKEDMCVLDFGCGSGALLCHMPAGRRIGVEVNPHAARVARSREQIEVYENIACVADGVVDLVISNHVLEHVLDPYGTLLQIRRKMRPGAKLALCLPIDDWRVQRRVDLEDPNQHLYTWTPLLLGNLLNAAGFDIERIWVLTHAWPPAGFGWTGIFRVGF